MNCLLTQTVKCSQNPKAPTLLLHTCCCVCLQSQMFNSTSPDIVDSCSGSTELIRILNRIGAIASNDTHKRYYTQFGSFQVLTSTFHCSRNFNSMQSHGYVYSGSMPVFNADIGKVNKNGVGSTLVPTHSKCQRLLSFETSEKLYMHASSQFKVNTGTTGGGGSHLFSAYDISSRHIEIVVTSERKLGMLLKEVTTPMIQAGKEEKEGSVIKGCQRFRWL